MVDVDLAQPSEGAFDDPLRESLLLLAGVRMRDHLVVEHDLVFEDGNVLLHERRVAAVVERTESVSVASGIVSITGTQPVARENALIVQMLTAEGIVSPLATA